tara:strand:+ start:137 stop:784 length:648 start_codon:yes stop_codon:yes gene_type:complete
MKYLFVIYTDLEYKEHLDHFKTQEFYRQICDDKNIEVMEWGSDFHTNYRDLPTKTQEMMKWCSENKEYDYLIKCDDTIFDDKWNFYRSKLTYENIFVNGRDGNCYAFTSKIWKLIDRHGFSDEWIISGVDTNKDYWGIHSLQLEERDWEGFVSNHDVEGIDVNFIKNDIPFYEGKFYMVSKNLSIFIGGQEKLAKELSKNFPVEDLMVGYLAESF